MDHLIATMLMIFADDFAFSHSNVAQTASKMSTTPKPPFQDVTMLASVRLVSGISVSMLILDQLAAPVV